MSAVQDEAEIGPVETSSDNDHDSITVKESNIHHNGLSETEENVERQRSLRWGEAEDEEQEGVDEGSIPDGDITGDCEESIKSDEGSIKSSGQAAASKAPEKPSSADGSLSTPDDTPSIQVRAPCPQD